MTGEAEQTDIEVAPATRSDQSVIANLFELYAYDFSEFYDLELGPDGRFGYEPLPLYWSEAGRHPFLVKIGGKLAGFVLVKQGSDISRNPAAWDLAEFFVARGFRRRGAGTRIAREIWKRFPGEWEVRVLEQNVGGNSFWPHAIQSFLGEPVAPTNAEKDGERWKVFSFVSPGIVATGY